MRSSVLFLLLLLQPVQSVPSRIPMHVPEINTNGQSFPIIGQGEAVTGSSTNDNVPFVAKSRSKAKNVYVILAATVGTVSSILAMFVFDNPLLMDLVSIFCILFGGIMVVLQCKLSSMEVAHRVYGRVNIPINIKRKMKSEVSQQ